MNCEMNLTAGYPAGHNEKAEWRVINMHGAPFDLCTRCVDTYKKKNPGWEDRGMTIVNLDLVEPPMPAVPFRP